ncbi:MAG: aminotransferase class V-fold PLP-dependent enzyme [Acidimicrobiales bacterium]
MGSNVYAELGVRRVLNAATTLTALGRTVLPEEVLRAMAGASRSCVSMEELHDAAGRRLAQLTRNDAAYVTSGCAAAITLATLAAITHGDPATIARIPGDESLARTVVMHRAHRIPYDRAIELGGGHILEIGNVIQTFEWELEAALDQSVAAVFWVAGGHLPQSALTLDRAVAIAHSRGVPVIVDAAAQLPPVENLWRYTVESGADLALFSGGKALQGPQASGLMVGSAKLIDAARSNGAPHQRFARALKAGKEEICGLVAAVERYLALDHAVLAKSWSETVDAWVAGLSDVKGVATRRVATNEAAQPVPRLEVTFERDDLDATRVAESLWDGDPRVAVLVADAKLFATPDTLATDDDAALVLTRLRAALGEGSAANVE